MQSPTRRRSIFVAEYMAHFHPAHAVAPTPAPLYPINEFAERLAGLAKSMMPMMRVRA